MGKICGQPTYKVMGAYRDKIPAYAALCELRSDEQRREDVQRLMEEGFRAVKLRLFMPTIQEDIRMVENIRAAVGDRMEILCDANQGPVRDRNFEGAAPFWSYQPGAGGRPRPCINWGCFGWRNRWTTMTCTGSAVSPRARTLPLPAGRL